MRDPYLYDDADVLRNNGNIKDADLLKQAEADVIRYTMVPIYSREFEIFDTETLKVIHREIFGALYPWAGEFRTIPIIKQEEILGGDTVRYAYPKQIKKELNDISKEIAKLKRIDDNKELVFRIVRLTAQIWQVHPFREGNTRSIVVFSVLLAQSLGLKVDYSLFKDNAAYVRNSLVWACQGIYSKFEYLEQIYYDAMLGEEAKKESSSAGENIGKYESIEGYKVKDYKEAPHIYDANHIEDK